MILNILGGELANNRLDMDSLLTGGRVGVREIVQDLVKQPGVGILVRIHSIRHITVKILISGEMMNVWQILRHVSTNSTKPYHRSPTNHVKIFIRHELSLVQRKGWNLATFVPKVVYQSTRHSHGLALVMPRVQGETTQVFLGGSSILPTTLYSQLLPQFKQNHKHHTLWRIYSQTPHILTDLFTL